VSVFGDFRIDTRPYSGYLDPSLPVATYIAQGTLLGDGTGGVLEISFLYQRADDAQISEMFNLEQIAVDTSRDGPIPVTMRLLGMDALAPNRLAFGQIWSLTLEDRFSGATDSALPPGALPRPLWFGAPNREEGNGLVRFTFANADTELYAVTIQGYMWGPRSVLAPGGPQRPVGSLFGQ